MTDLRSRLADALREAAYPAYFGGGPPSQSQCGTVLPIEVAVDVLLSLPGIATLDANLLRDMEAAAAKDVDRALTIENREFSIGYRAALRDVIDAAAAVQAQEEQ